MFLINDENFVQRAFTGGKFGRGYRRPPKGQASSYLGSKFEDNFELIPREEWPERVKDMERTKSRLSDLDTQTPLDQGQQGFCWAYSTAQCYQLLRLIQGSPAVRLSPHGMACLIYNYQDRGAWGAVSFDWMMKHGCPSEDTWPARSMSRSNDTPEMRADMARNRLTEGFIDLNVPHPADADLSFDQAVSLNLSGIPTVDDFDWWRHSVAGLDLVDLKPQLGQQGLYDPNRWGRRIKNSWGVSWGERGYGVLTGNKAVPNGGCAPLFGTV